MLYAVIIYSGIQKKITHIGRFVLYSGEFCFTEIKLASCNDVGYFKCGSFDLLFPLAGGSTENLKIIILPNIIK